MDVADWLTDQVKRHEAYFDAKMAEQDAKLWLLDIRLARQTARFAALDEK